MVPGGADPGGCGERDGVQETEYLVGDVQREDVERVAAAGGGQE